MSGIDYATLQMGFVFLALLGALYLYASENLPIELTSLWVLGVLMFLFHFMPVIDTGGTVVMKSTDLLVGLANPVVLTLFSLMIMGHALSSTGALEIFVNALFRRGSMPPTLKIISALCVVGILSGFLNNVPVVIIFIPIFVALTKKLHMCPSQWMMPLSFVAILGGMTTVLGSSTNLLVSGMVNSVLGAPLDFFAFTEIGVILATVGMVYLAIFAPKILPEKSLLIDQVTPDERRFFTTVVIDEHSPLSGRQIAGRRVKGFNGYIMQIERGKNTFTAPFEDQVILPNDRVLVQANRETLIAIASRKLGNLSPDTEHKINRFKSLALSEIMVTFRSRCVGRTLRTLNLKRNQDITPIGIERSTGVVKRGFMDTPLQSGDILLVLTTHENIRNLSNDSDLAPIQSNRHNIRHHHHVIHTLAIFAITIALSATGSLPISLATFIGAITMITSGCISFEEALKSVDYRAIFLIITSLALGMALQVTGGANAIATTMIAISDGLPPTVILSIFFIVVTIMTNILSNQATAILFTPIAISLAQVLKVDVNAFIFAVIFATNCCFATPFAYQTNILVMTPGQYKFNDYIKLGAPLILIIWALYTVIAPLYFGF